MTSQRDPQWIFTKPCGDPVGVAEGRLATTPARAMRLLYETNAERRDAAERGITARLISFEEYDNLYYPRMSLDYVCTHGERK